MLRNQTDNMLRKTIAKFEIWHFLESTREAQPREIPWPYTPCHASLFLGRFSKLPLSTLCMFAKAFHFLTLMPRPDSRGFPQCNSSQRRIHNKSWGSHLKTNQPAALGASLIDKGGSMMGAQPSGTGATRSYFKGKRPWSLPCKFFQTL